MTLKTNTTFKTLPAIYDEGIAIHVNIKTRKTLLNLASFLWYDCVLTLSDIVISYRTSVHENVQFVRRILTYADWYFFYQLSGSNGSSSFLNVPSPLSQMISPQLDGSSGTSGSSCFGYTAHLGGEPAQMLQVSAMMVVVIGHIYLFFIVCRF